MSSITLHVGDITTDPLADALVNAANTGLLGGGGVDGAVHRAAGPEVMRECRRIGGCPVGEARVTGPGRLPRARHIIHAVGPVWRGGGEGEPALLAGSYRHSVELADAHGCRRVAFPAISTGAFGYPLQRAADVSLAATSAALEDHPGVLEARFWLFDVAAFDCFARALAVLQDGGPRADG